MTARLITAVLCGLLALLGGWETARSAGRSWPPPPQTLETLAAHIGALPTTAEIALAAAATEVGHWRLVSRAGEPFTAAGPAELARALRTLAPEAEANPGRLVLYLADDTVFRYRASLRDLPETADLRLVVDGKPMRLVRRGRGKQTLLVELGPRLLVEPGGRQELYEALRQLRLPLERSRVRTLALEPGGPTTLPRSPRPNQATRRAEVDSIDPGHLMRALPALAGQSVLLAGRIDNGRLVYRPSSEPDGTLPLADLFAAAAAADVNLLILATASSRQPGTRNRLWQRMELAHIERAIGRSSLGEFLDALAGEPAAMVARVAGHGPSRLELELRAVRDLDPGTIDAITDAVSGTWSDLVSETAGRLAVLGFHASLLTAERQAELDRRWLPGVPSHLQIAALALLAAGLLSLRRLDAWWQRIWPPEAEVEYAGRTGYLLAWSARVAIFVLVFVPLAALPALCAGLAGRIASAIALARGVHRAGGSNH